MTTDNKYLSKYSNGKTVSAAQYITELICENKAKKDKLDLHYRFWTSKVWASYYRNQIASSHKLLSTYPAKAIINALRSSDAAKIYSLRAPHLPAIIEREQEKLANQNNVISTPICRYTDNKDFRKNNTRNSIISKLKDIDNES